MLMRSRLGRSVVAALLCSCVATVTASSTALAQARGNSGLPAGSGNPMADLQTQMTTLQQQTAALQTQISSLAALGKDVSTLKDQMKSLMALQDQVAALIAQTTRQADALAALGTDVSGLKEQLTVLATMQRQLLALSSQVTALSNLQGRVTALTTQVEALAAQSASGAYDSLGVYDDRSQKIGDVIGVENNVPWVALTAGDHTIVLQVFPQRLVGQNLWYDGANCTGNAYINGQTLANGASVFSLAAVLDPGGVIYAANAEVAPAGVQLLSLRDKTTGFCFNSRAFNSVLPAQPVFTLDSMFQRPYHVR